MLIYYKQRDDEDGVPYILLAQLQALTLEFLEAPIFIVLLTTDHCLLN